MHQLCAVEALLALALLHQKVVTAVAVKGQFTASGTSDAFLCAAMRLELGHEPDDLSRAQSEKQRENDTLTSHKSQVKSDKYVHIEFFALVTSDL